MPLRYIFNEKLQIFEPEDSINRDSIKPREYSESKNKKQTLLERIGYFFIRCK